MSHHLSPEMRACIENCLRCYSICLSSFSGHCLEAGGPHTEPAHARLMLACAEICRTSAHFMLLGTPHHRHTCRECAEICRECADDCERVGGMEECVAACRSCAESCAAMAA
ncbi:four-helix bundle copper-binding protein [Teichococcus aestuarii]|uniref:Ferredoxin n=1 Tax=Teichococcus aestuarii TaxID=568898 RepID=A0A2U1V1J0_9PROT|nr:four-helix bundle copper-binding protein [Pseudoroseomonas aestuarii]PWC27769.1 ferredoxin [Pseudoroseomonas aestuarii]